MKRLVDVDDGALDAARQQLGTSTIKETVNTALRLAAGPGHNQNQIDAALDVLGGIEFADRDDAWR